MTDVISRVLLHLEWVESKCSTCTSARPNHAPMCTMDEALSMRGFHTQSDRDAARERIKYSSAPTLPPTGDESLDELEEARTERPPKHGE